MIDLLTFGSLIDHLFGDERRQGEDFEGQQPIDEVSCSLRPFVWKEAKTIGRENV